jgi:hypothetical protein
MKKGLIGFWAGLVMVLLGCATTSSVLEYKEISLDEYVQNRRSYRDKPPKHGFIIEEIIFMPYVRNYVAIGSENSNNNVSIHTNDSCGKNHKCSENVEKYDGNDLIKRANGQKVKMYISYYKINQGGDKSWFPFADKIVGLRTDEEITAIEEEKIATAEARRIAEEEANRYDPSKFTIVPSIFKPSSYKSIDLFTAVTNVKNIPNSLSALSDYYKLNHVVTFDYVSEVVFVNQNGTDILFRTNDNAISQNMNVNDRSGLTSGQKVRLYYRITGGFYTLAEWRVVAIERL